MASHIELLIYRFTRQRTSASAVTTTQPVDTITVDSCSQAHLSIPTVSITAADAQPRSAHQPQGRHLICSVCVQDLLRSMHQKKSLTPVRPQPQASYERSSNHYNERTIVRTSSQAAMPLTPLLLVHVGIDAKIQTPSRMELGFHNVQQQLREGGGGGA